MTSEALLRKGKTSLRKGWCPGALRPMSAKDGLLVRLRISGGTVSAAAMRALAQAGRDHGNGLFDLSARANLQMRGVREERLPQLIETLDDLGLIDQDAAAEAVRNVLISPLAGLDGRTDVRGAGQALEKLLVTNKDLHALPGKFGILIDDGSALSLAHAPADIRFDWAGDGHENIFAIGIGGVASDAINLGHCDTEEIPDIASRLARAFLRLTSPMRDPPRRMLGLVQACGPAAIAEEAGLRHAPPQWRPAIEEPCPIGLLRLHETCFGAGAAFGRLNAGMLDAVALAAEAFGSGEIRLTPWRAFIVPHVQAKQDEALRAHFSAYDFIVNRHDPRLAIAACGGADACERGTTETHADALALMLVARRLRKTGVALHVTGCAKGCARQAATPFTLIAEQGLYTLVTDAMAQGAGKATGLSLAMAQKMLEMMTQKAEPQRELEQS
jgi:precorrin-3B synthase